MSDNSLLVFTHIDCTGGAAFGNMLDAYYWQYQSLRTKLFADQVGVTTMEESRREHTSWILSAYRKNMARTRVVRGHFHISYDQRDIWQKPAQYVTFLRDPVRRFISNRAYRIPDMATLMALRERPEIDFNLQTTYLSGCTSLCAGSQDLALAKNNLRQYALVGLTEEFDAAVELFTKIFALPYIGWWHEQRTVTKRKPVVPEDVREQIREWAWMDVELYELGKRLLTEKLAEYREVPLRKPTRMERAFCRLRRWDFQRSRVNRQVGRLLQQNTRMVK